MIKPFKLQSSQKPNISPEISTCTKLFKNNVLLTTNEMYV